MATRKKDDGGGHAPLPPSASSRWLKCPPSQGYIRRLVDEGTIARRKSGPAAERGTRIHDFGDRVARQLLSGVSPGRTMRRPKGAAEDEFDEAKEYARYLVKKRDDMEVLYGPSKTGLEDRAVLVADTCWGQRDAWMFARSHLCVIDLKTGREPVDPVGNTQMIIYAADLVRQLDPSTIELCIWQPNAHDGREGERSYTYSRDEYDYTLVDIYSGVDQAAAWLKRKTGHESELSPGDHCRWCDALGVCPAARRKNMAISSKEFKPIALSDFRSPPDPDTLSTDQLAEIMRRAPEFKVWLEAIATRALELAAKGREIPGFKVVERITHRVITPGVTDSRLARGIGLKTTDILRTTRMPLTQIEKLLDEKGREKLKKFVFKPQGLPTVVAESDRRVPMLATKINFTPLSNEESDDA